MKAKKMLHEKFKFKNYLLNPPVYNFKEEKSKFFKNGRKSKKL